MGASTGPIDWMGALDRAPQAPRVARDAPAEP